MRTVLIGALLLTFMAPGTAEAKSPLVVVFDIEDQARALKPQDRRSLSEYIAAKLAESGQYRVVPMSRLRKLLRTRKIRRCREWGCKSSIGWEFKSHKLLATRLMRLGRQCVLTSNMHGLKSAAVERSATAKGACRQEALTTLVEKVVATLTGKGDVEPQQKIGRKKDEPGAPGAAARAPGADEPGLARTKKVRKKRVRKPPPRKVVVEKDEPRGPFPLWPALVSAGVGVVGLGVGLPLLAIHDKGANCEGPTLPNYANCDSIYNTNGGGWALTAIGLAGVVGTGVLLYFYFTSPEEAATASTGIQTVGLTPLEGGAAFGLTGRF